jgi:hypothetical protein
MAHEAPFARQLDALADTLRTATDLAKVLDQFEQLTFEQGFLEAGRPEASKKIEAALKILATKVAGKNAPVMLLTPPVRMAHRGFAHGAAAIGPKMGMYFYFEELDLGLAAIGDANGTDYFRFAAVVVPTSGPKPS